MDEHRLKPEFYLIANIDNPALTADNFDAVCGALSVQCVLLEGCAALDADPEEARNIISHIQSRGIAVLISNAAGLDGVDMASRFAADGVHLEGDQNIKAGFDRIHARLGKKAIIGVEVGNSRHDAMERAEKDAGYIAFDCPHDEMLEMIVWWAELFEIPSVAWRITDPAMAETCADAGADFIAIDLGALNLDVTLSGKSLADALAPFQIAINNVDLARVG